ncbi:uncharacterized protein LAJ45_09047 [Morchella importuna]|uniref:uncharacterized protein n=1 Tax=Morchella importuna TaxID=1174673 RepID=UPI001E8E2937|nr:uncharacterized protein LAJ45_09047 [Morchella importuna]KAH8146966.1 hypothetical protein LAJ45_09047 [Morchella importuna]
MWGNISAEHVSPELVVGQSVRAYRSWHLKLHSSWQERKGPEPGWGRGDFNPGVRRTRDNGLLGQSTSGISVWDEQSISAIALFSRRSRSFQRGLVTFWGLQELVHTIKGVASVTSSGLTGDKQVIDTYADCRKRNMCGEEALLCDNATLESQQGDSCRVLWIDVLCGNAVWYQTTSTTYFMNSGSMHCQSSFYEDVRDFAVNRSSFTIDSNLDTTSDPFHLLPSRLELALPQEASHAGQ